MTPYDLESAVERADKAIAEGQPPLAQVYGLVSLLLKHGAEREADRLLQERYWRPIETAPKDGTSIMLHPHYIITHWSRSDQAFVWDNKPITISLTHWMPLPTPPER